MPAASWTLPARSFARPACSLRGARVQFAERAGQERALRGGVEASSAAALGARRGAAEPARYAADGAGGAFERRQGFAVARVAPCRAVMPCSAAIALADVACGPCAWPCRLADGAARAGREPASCFSEGSPAAPACAPSRGRWSSSIEPASACVAPFLQRAGARERLRRGRRRAAPSRCARRRARRAAAPRRLRGCRRRRAVAGAGARRPQAALQLLGAAAGLARGRSTSRCRSLLPPVSSLLDSCSWPGSLPSGLVCALSSPGPATEATLRSVAICVLEVVEACKRRRRRDRPVRVDDDQVVGGRPAGAHHARDLFEGLRVRGRPRAAG